MIQINLKRLLLRIIYGSVFILALVGAYKLIEDIYGPPWGHTQVSDEVVENITMALNETDNDYIEEKLKNFGMVQNHNYYYETPSNIGAVQGRSQAQQETGQEEKDNYTPPLESSTTGTTGTEKRELPPDGTARLNLSSDKSIVEETETFVQASVALFNANPDVEGTITTMGVTPLRYRNALKAKDDAYCRSILGNIMVLNENGLNKLGDPALYKPEVFVKLMNGHKSAPGLDFKISSLYKRTTALVDVEQAILRVGFVLSGREGTLTGTNDKGVCQGFFNRDIYHTINLKFGNLAHFDLGDDTERRNTDSSTFSYKGLYEQASATGDFVKIRPKLQKAAATKLSTEWIDRDIKDAFPLLFQDKRVARDNRLDTLEKQSRAFSVVSALAKTSVPMNVWHDINCALSTRALREINLVRTLPPLAETPCYVNEIEMTEITGAFRWHIIEGVKSVWSMSENYSDFQKVIPKGIKQDCNTLVGYDLENSKVKGSLADSHFHETYYISGLKCIYIFAIVESKNTEDLNKNPNYLPYTFTPIQLATGMAYTSKFFSGN